MQNPFLSLATGIPGNYGELCMAGRLAAVTYYKFYDTFGHGDLLITRKDQFPTAESAFVTIVNKFLEIDQEDNSAYVPPFTEDEFIWDAEQWLTPTYCMQEIKEIPAEKFLEKYESVNDIMTGFETFSEEGKNRFVYKTSGIFKAGQEYTGNYRWFDPLRGLVFEKCFSLFDDGWKKIEYLGVSAQFYIYLTWMYTPPQQT